MSGPQQQPSREEDPLQIIVMIAIAIFIGIAFVAGQMGRINGILGAITWLHVAPFAYAARFVPFLTEIPFLGSWLFVPCLETHLYLAKGGYALMDLTPETMGHRNKVQTAGGRAALILYMPWLVNIAFKGRQFRVDHLYRTRHTLESMITVQSETWHTSRTARHVNPLKIADASATSLAKAVRERVDAPRLPGRLLPRDVMTIEPGTWSRALRPEEWLLARAVTFDRAEYDVMTSPDGPARRDFRFRRSWERLDIDTLSEVLSEQLRAPWQGPDKLRPCLRALLAVMSLFHDYNVDGGNKLLSDLALLADATRLKPRGMDAAISGEPEMLKRIDAALRSNGGQRLVKMGDKHCWVESAFPTFLYYARKDRGVLPSAAFLWLKNEDRQMWYILNNVGNEAVMAEAAGALAHNRAEIQVGCPIARPAVYQAARAMLEDYLDITPARVEARRTKEERSRDPARQLELIRAEILDTGERAENDLAADAK